MSNDIIQRLNAEADSYDDGSHMQALCSDSAERIAALEVLVDGADTSRKVLFVDNDNKTRLANDHQKRLDEALSKLEDSVGMAELYKEDNDLLRAALKAHGEEAARG